MRASINWRAPWHIEQPNVAVCPRYLSAKASLDGIRRRLGAVYVHLLHGSQCGQGETVNAPSTVFQESLLPWPVPVKINVKLLPPLRYHLGARFHWNRVFGTI